MDTSIYWDQANKYLPDKIDILFIAESPPAFRNPDKMSYIYFENNRGSDILFATIMKALFNVNYRKDPEWKKGLLERFKREKRCFLVDGVQYPINRDTKWQKVPARMRVKQVRKNEKVLLKLLGYLEKKRHIDDNTRVILIKETVFNALYYRLSNKYDVLNEGPVGFPRWHRDPIVVIKIQNILNR